ncbi:unnamed protein product [Lepeophtheirus salmonis]|uniref:Transporter n=1 Tax=Lepeophtheirus salmonis TaxID=72036 RepID=A0A7R8CHB7_LEPSM|nr:unnamed protein product [Lepeophtheirus salmonis]CAF2765966.1 unnamed protein product [Lepeophtheirus salmonis]
MSTDKKENEKDRGYWTHPYDFLVTSLGYAVGLGNIWRFPFLCYKHGGGSFLIPYFIMLILAGLSPFLKGLGFSMVTLGLLFALFYNVVVSWSIWYLKKCVPVDKITEIPGVSSVEEYFNEFVLGGGANTTWENYGYPRIHSFVSYVTTIFPYIILIAIGIRAFTLPGASQGVFETVLSSITDYWPDLRDKKSRIVACITFIMMILSIPFSAPGGIHLFTLFNSTVPSWNLLLIIFLEIIGIGWGYGANNFINDITNDMKIKVCLPLKLLWLFSWTFATPLVLLCLLVQFWRNYGTVEYNGYVYPKYIQILGNILTILTLIWIPIFAIKALTSKKGEEESLEPHGKWGRESYGGVESVSSIESNM